MRVLGNIIWLIFGGLATALEYFAASIPLFISIVGIPFGIQTIKIGLVQLWPFEATIRKREIESGLLYSILNILWFIFAGIPIFLTHILFGILLAITIVGLPFAKQHFKLSGLALSPFGRIIEYN